MAGIGTPTRTTRAGAVALGALLLGLCVGLARPASAATHYPAGSSCYDCHAVSESKMVVGTRLIKRSQKTIDLDITGSATPIKCLFCHERNASSVANRTEMRPVWDHFDSSSLSKHLVKDATATPATKTYSTFLADGASFDCLDCHVGLNTGVVSDGTGNARVHGIDAGTQSVNLYTTLVGAPANASQVNANTCQNVNCHDANGGAVSGYSAPPRHTYADATINDGAAPADCLACHGKHNSYQNSSLVVLRADGTTSNNPTDPATGAVTPEKCGECHNQDDDGDAGTAGVQSDWNQRGHGKPTSYGTPARAMGLNCLSCHDSATPHDWTGTDKRFSLPVVSGLSGMGTGKSMLSLCTTCHAGFSAHKATAGCLDCHDPHGQNMGTAGNYNIMMVRRQVPLASPQDANVFARSGVHDTGGNFEYWRAGDTSGLSGSSRGICDNGDCHGGVQNPNAHAVWPLVNYIDADSFGAEHGLGQGGAQVAGSNCQGCHKHSITDPGAGFGGAAACDDCHGFPPNAGDPYVDNPDAVGVHALHVSIYGTSNCNLCHYNNNHNESGWGGNTGIVIPAANVDVAFNPSLNPPVTIYTPAYAPVTNTCSNLRCHNPDSGPVGTGVGITGKSNAITTNAPVWANAFTAINACTGCHTASPAGNPDGGSHYDHDNAAGKAYSCRVCHAGEDAAGNSYSGTHARGTLNRDSALVQLDATLAGLPAGGSYVDGAAGTLVGGQCENLYCHGATLTNSGGSRIAAPNWPTWGTVATGACGTCHDGDGRIAPAGDSSVIASGNHTDHLTATYGPQFGAAGCGNCHSAYALNSANHVDGGADFDNIAAAPATSPLGTLPVTVPTATDTDRCTYCHSSGVALGQTLSGTQLAKQNWATPAYVLGCETCHTGVNAGASAAWSKAEGAAAVDPKVQAPAKDTNYTSTGHGRTSGNYNATGAPPANMVCTVCHDTAVAHISHVLDNTDRLRAVTESPALAYTTVVSEVCLDCHKVGQGAAGGLGRDATREASVHSGGVTTRYDSAAEAATAFPAYGNSANYGLNPGYQCADCHDAHGTTKLAMILPTLDGRLGGASNPVAIANFQSTDTNLLDLDPTAAANDGVCDACHTAAGQPHPDTARAGNHNQGVAGQACMGCHDHGQSFVGSCTGCHGGGLAGEGNANWWPDSTAGVNGTAYPNRMGDHQQHVDAIYAVNAATLPGATPTEKKNNTCNWCHPSPGNARGGTTGEASHDDGGTWAAPADVHGDGRAGAPVTNFKTIANVAQVPQGTYDNTVAANGKDCSNVDCHYRVTTPTTGTPTAAGDGWYQPAAVATCSNCHGIGTAGAALPNSHPAHVAAPGANPTPGMGHGCWYCHPSGVNNASYTMSHQTGVVNWSFAGLPAALDPAPARTELYNGTATGTTTVKFGTGTFNTCASLYCHGNFPNGATANAPTWGTTATGGCGTCHGVYGSPFNSSAAARVPIATGNHRVHFQQYNSAGVAAVEIGPRLDPHPGNAPGGCNACHNIDGNCTTACHMAAGANHPTGTHVDGRVDFRTDVFVYPPGITDAFASATLAATPACNNCHSTTVAVGQAQSGVALAKTPANWANGSYRLACVTCHNTAGAAWSKAGGAAAGAPTVQAPGKDTYYTADNGGHGRAGTYTATGNAAPGYTLCTECHAAAGAHITHALGEDRLTGGLTELTACAECHVPGRAGVGAILGRDATVEASNHATAVTGRYASNPAYNYGCVACHDPHGTSNIAMVNTTIVDGMGASAAGVTLAAETGLDPTNAADNGVCDRCHQDAGQAHANTAHPNNHNFGATCLTCHDHTRSFEGSCTGCHGGGLASEGNENWWPDSVVGGHGTAHPNRLADHQQHIDAIAVARFGATPTTAQKNTTCATCHPNPGIANHNLNTGGSLASTADVHGDPQNTGTSFQNILGAANGLATDTYDNTTVAGGKDCANVDCHYRTATPTTGTPTANGDGWYQPLAVATCNNCHQDGATALYNPGAAGALPNAHLIHVEERADTGYDYPCAYCHPAHGTNQGHQNAVVNVVLTAALGEPGAVAGSVTNGGNAPKFGGAGTYPTCNNLYCHGADMPAGATGSDLTPEWNVVTTGDCGTCHDTGNADTTPTVIASGNHTDHLTATYGPQFGPDNVTSCIQCHPAYFSASHVNNQKDFVNVDATPNPVSTLGSTAPLVDPPLTSTDRCSHCHSTASVTTVSLPGGAVGTVLAKANWANGAYQLDCLTCHNGIDPATDNAAGATGPTDPTAPDTRGDYANYGAEVRGHNRPTAAGPYTDVDLTQTNVAANKACSACHNTAATHFDNAVGTTYATQRLLTTINGVATGSTVTGACNACHTGAGTTPATSAVSTHGNTNAAFTATSTHDANAEAFVYNCAACHDAHGMTKNDRTATSANVFMIKRTIGVGNSFTTTPGGANATTATVIFERVTGTDSKDDGLTQADNVCVTCHTNANRPGGGTALTNDDGNHSENNDYTGNEYGNNCSSCHQHNYDTDAGGTVDGFMPLQCNSCHTYPGLPVIGGTHRMGTVHDVHVGGPQGTVVANKGFACNQCHYNSHHNTAGIAGPAQWGTVTDAHIQVRFNPSYNPTAAATNPAPTTSDATAYTEASNTCASLYCHGSTLGAGGSNTTPSWVIDTVVCGSCHDGDGRSGAGVGDGSVASAGNHTDHLTATYGPGFGAAGCGSCHPAYATNALTHVNTTKDFDNVAAAPATSPLGTLPVTTPTATDTDRCTHCHSTAPIAGVGVGAALAKTNWTNGSYVLDCLTCHNATDPGTRNGDGTGVLAPAKDAFWATRGHGLPSASTYPWSGARAGANSACSSCHNGASAHLSGVLSDSDRLLTSGNGLCNGCHDGAGAGAAVSQVSTHANTSTTMTTTYTRQRNQFELNCTECHDVHGSANIFMVATVNSDGPLVATRLYNGVANLVTFLFRGTVAFTDDSVGTSTTAGVGYANPTTGAGSYASKICQTCHTSTVHFQFDSNDGHVNTDCIVCHKHDFDGTFTAASQDGFMPAGCNGCHGYPPVRAGEEGGNPDYLAANYAGGGGFHKAHVEALKARLANSNDAREICGPCHGDGAGSTNHAQSGQSTGAWPTTARAQVNIRVKAAAQNSWDGMASDPLGATYGGGAVNATGTFPANAAMNQANSTCAGVDCHGNPPSGEGLWWNMTVTDGAGASDGLSKSQTCKGCHDQTPSEWRIYNAAGTLTSPTHSAPDAAAVYYGTLSGYSRGGHGDATINSINDPSFVDSGTGSTPIDCTACHDDAAAHFPEGANLHRLVNTTIENTTHSSAGLCNSCHAGADYPGVHHPSFYGSTLGNPVNHDIVPQGTQEILTAVSGTTSWSEVPSGSGHFEQNHYGAANYSGNADRFTNWWAGSYTNANQDPPPRPVFYGEAQSASPKALLPVERYVLASGTSNRIMCVTCHNPHGTDLYTFDSLGGHQSVPDNNMLRLRDADNTLCNACH